MKKLSLVVHASLQQELADCLRGLGVETFMFSHIEEHSAQREHDPLLSARDRVVGYVPMIRVDILLEDARVDNLLQAIREAAPSIRGRGFHWVTRLERSGPL